MGGGPCRLKQILDSGVAANRGFECMRNTADIAAAYTAGKATPSKELDEEFRAAAEAYAVACAKVEEELAGFLPPDEP